MTSLRKRKFRTLASLLDAQPKGLTRDPEHRLLWDGFLSSEKMMKLRISPRCWHLLNSASIPPENIKNFYRTYRLPHDPFFPLFLAVKSRWLRDRGKWKDDRDAAIINRMKDLPEIKRKSLRILAEFEEAYHPGGLRPLWDSKIFPTSKKRTEELLKMDDEGWYRLWQEYLRVLSDRYPDSRESGRSARLLASLVLNCPPDDRKATTKAYRRLSKSHHPDHGGNNEAFRRLKEARDVLLEN